MLGLWLNITTHKMILLPYLLFFFYVHNVISLLIIVFFRLPCPPLAKRGSLTHSQALALSKRARDVTALRCSEPLRSKVGGPSKVFAMLCGMGPPGEKDKYLERQVIDGKSPYSLFRNLHIL